MRNVFWGQNREDKKQHFENLRCCFLNHIVTIQDAPPPHSHFEHFVFFFAFDKAKNAHWWEGQPY